MQAATEAYGNPWDFTDPADASGMMVIKNPTVPQVPALPFAEQIPTPKELIDNQAKFASKLVSTNKSVALAVAKAAQPLTDQLLDRSSGPRSTRATAKAA